MKFLAFALLAALLGACSQVDLRRDSSKPKPDPLSESETSVYMKAMGDYEKGRFKEAAQGFEAFIARTTTSPRYVTAVYHLGICHRNLNEVEKSVENFRVVARLAAANSPELEALSLYQLALSYEAKGDKAKTIAALVDVERRLRFFPQEQAEVEIPARLASAYAWVGDESVARKHFQKAEAGLKRLRAGEKSVPSWLPRTLFNMGNIHLSGMAEGDFDSGLKSLLRSQVWLYQAIEVNDPTWSKQAHLRLKNIYEEGWNLIQGVPLEDGEDRLYALKQQQQARLGMAAGLRAALDRLEYKELPETDKMNPFLEEWRRDQKDLGQRLDLLLSTRPVEQGLTESAQEREGVLRQGKVIDPEGSLEKKTQKKRSGSKATKGSDPNL